MPDMGSLIPSSISTILTNFLSLHLLGSQIWHPCPLVTKSPLSLPITSTIQREGSHNWGTQAILTNKVRVKLIYFPMAQFWRWCWNLLAKDALKIFQTDREDSSLVIFKILIAIHVHLIIGIVGDTMVASCYQQELILGMCSTSTQVRRIPNIWL